jgi:hypothetical protein
MVTSTGVGFVVGYTIACFHDRPYSQKPTAAGRLFIEQDKDK